MSYITVCTVASNVVLQKLLVLKGVPNNCVFIGIDQSGRVCPVTYVSYDQISKIFYLQEWRCLWRLLLCSCYYCDSIEIYWLRFLPSPTIVERGVGRLATFINPLDSKGNYSATSNNTKLVHWPLMGGLLHLIQRGGDWAGWSPAQSPPRCTKCNSPPINVQCTNQCIAIWWSVVLRF